MHVAFRASGKVQAFNSSRGLYAPPPTFWVNGVFYVQHCFGPCTSWTQQCNMHVTSGRNQLNMQTVRLGG